MRKLRRVKEVPVFRSTHGMMFEDDVIGARGDRGQYLRWSWRADGVVAIPTCGDRVALINTYRYALSDHSLELPRGGIGADETVIEAAIRETREEAGLLASGAQQLGVLYADSGLIENPLTVVRVLVASEERIPGDESEPFEAIEQETCWFSQHDLLVASADGRIRCGITMAALWKSWAHIVRT